MSELKKIDALDLARSFSTNVFSLKELLADQSVPKVEPLVEGLIAKEEFVALYATAKTAKTFLAMNLGLCVATGRPFLGFPTRPGKVVFVENELSRHRLKERFEKLKESMKFDISDEDFIIVKERFDLQDANSILQLNTTLAACEPSLVIFDPLFCMHRAEENSAREMIPVLNEFKKLTQALPTRPAIVLIHHVGKRGEGSGNQASHMARGTSALADVPDAIWLLSRTSDDSVRRLTIEQRYGPTIDPLDIKFDQETALFSLIGNSQNASRAVGSPRDILEIVSGYNGIEKFLLEGQFCKKFGVASRTFEDRLSDAMKHNLIRRELHDKKAVYFANESSASPQPPIGTCEAADENRGRHE